MMKKMRLWTTYIALASLLMLVATGCVKDSGVAAGGNAADGTAVPSGGELSYALATSPDTLDPHRSGLAVAVRVMRTMYDSLVVQLPDNTIKPWLATEWSISPDGKSYTFKLRKDVKFHDGTPFNAEAVKFNFDRILDPETKANNALPLLKPYKSADILDEHTVRLNLETPSAAFLGNLSQALLGIVSPAAAKQYGDDFGRHPVGTGPFTFVKWNENADIQVAKNPDYAWAPDIVSNKGQAYLDKIAFKIVPEEATRLGSVQSGQVLAAETVPPQNVVALKNDPKTQLLQANTVGLPYTLFFNLRHAPWNDTKARQAVQAALDVDAIVKTLYLGTYQRAWSALTPGIFGYDASLENSVKQDIPKANRLLDELGWAKGADGIRVKDGKKLTLHYVDGTPNREKRNDIAVIVQQQLKQVGIAVEIEITKDVATVIYKNGAHDLYGNSQVNSDPDALKNFYRTQEPNALRLTIAGLADPALDQLLDQGTHEHDLSKREDIYKKVQRYLIDNAVIIPIYVFPYTVAASKSVNGLKFDSLGYPLFNDVKVRK